MSTITAASHAAATRTRRPRPWVGMAGAATLLVAAAVPFLTVPQASGVDAAEQIAAFYADSDRYRAIVFTEPLIIISGFLLLWFSANLRDHLRRADGDDRRATVAFAGAFAFSMLAPVALLVQATPAGTLVFSAGLDLDPHTALLFHHIGYVLLVMAMAGAAAVTAATGSLIRDTGVLGRGSARASIAIAVLALASLPFVYAPLVVFLVWVAVMSVRLPAALTER